MRRTKADPDRPSRIAALEHELGLAVLGEHDADCFPCAWHRGGMRAAEIERRLKPPPDPRAKPGTVWR